MSVLDKEGCEDDRNSCKAVFKIKKELAGSEKLTG
jgi:hypothetical protein